MVTSVFSLDDRRVSETHADNRSIAADNDFDKREGGHPISHIPESSLACTEGLPRIDLSMGGLDRLPRDPVSPTLLHFHVRVLNLVTVCGTVPNCSGGRFTKHCSSGSHAASETGINVGLLVDTFTFAYGILSIVVSTNIHCSLLHLLGCKVHAIMIKFCPSCHRFRSSHTTSLGCTSVQPVIPMY